MYARIGPSRARGFHVAAEQHAQGILEVALHGGLTRLTSEAAERRALYDKVKARVWSRTVYQLPQRPLLRAYARCLG